MACGTCNGTGFVVKDGMVYGCDDLKCGSVQPETQKHNAEKLKQQEKDKR